MKAVREGQGFVVSVVLPCLNEVQSVGLCVREAREALVSAGISGEVIVVDNGSTDGSAAAAVASGARVIREERPGYGSAVRAGIRAAGGSIVVMADADWSYDLGKLPELVRPILQGRADLVLGSRANGATRRTMPLLHRFVGNPGITFLIGRACGRRLGVRDSQSGFRAFRRGSVAELGLRGEGMEFASEMLIRATQAGLRVVEVATGYRERLGRSKLRTWPDGLRHFKLILGLAPDLALIGPGAVLIAVGVLLSATALVDPSGLTFGSLRWQPVFFSSIALVLGTQAVLAGAVLAHRLSLVTDTAFKRFDVVGRPSFPRRCLTAGLAAAALGLALDAVLFVVWIGGGPAPSRALALASLAQSLLIIGATFAAFAMMARVLRTGSFRVEAPVWDEVHGEFAASLAEPFPPAASSRT